MKYIIASFLTKCRDSGINIAAETCGYVPLKIIKAAMNYVDLFLFDIKSLNAEKFKSFTGGDLNTVKTAFEALCGGCPEKVIARVPVIPDFNNNDISEIMEYVQKNGVKEIHLLPYHTLGISKYEQLGRKYKFACRESLDSGALTQYAEIGEKLGLTVRIGG